MKHSACPVFLTGLFCLLGPLSCLPSKPATLLVWQGSPSPTPPYANWATAAPTIQAAVDAAHAGDTVLVTNGVYANGGRAVYGIMTNRVAVDQAIVVQSVNGPRETVIRGYQVPGTINGDGATRCVYLTNGAVLSGFTLTNGATRALGDLFVELSGGGVWCEYPDALITNCTLTGNSAFRNGGGAYGGTLNNCTVTANSAESAGGAFISSLNNCTLMGNSAVSGGGAYYGTLNNCVVTGNSAAYAGGGAYYARLNNCTVTGNSAWYFGGGVQDSTLNNSIVYYNTAFSWQNYVSSTMNYCCTTPLPDAGSSNITADPQLAGASHITANSPCRGAGSAAYASGPDIDGEAWLNPPSIGCDEYRPSATTGALAVAIGASFRNVAVGFAVDLRAQISGPVTTSEWDFGDGTLLSNQPYVSHAWNTTGDYSVVLRAYNQSHPDGVSGTITVRVLAQPVHYVWPDSPGPMLPYNSWAAAARTIQEAVDAATMPGALVLVTNGVYATGGRFVYGTMTNRVAVDRPVVVQSVNGPAVTLIQGCSSLGSSNGDGAIRCAYLTNGAVLSGFTLTNGATRVSGDYFREQAGGGVCAESINAVVTNCVLTRNSAHGVGAGAFAGTLINCTLSGNAVDFSGGGAAYSTINGCVLAGNTAFWYGGGTYAGTLNNCTLNNNSVLADGGQGGGVCESTLNHCTLASNRTAGPYGEGGGACGGTLNDSVISGNVADSGGGARNSILHDCTLVNNSALSGYGGGAYLGTLRNSTLTGNWSFSEGGGAAFVTLDHCALTNNSAAFGGGASGGTMDKCVLAYNSAASAGGGAYYVWMTNCTLTGNSAESGGGAYWAILNNCTLTGNSAAECGGGAYLGELRNCISYLNSAGSNANYFGFYSWNVNYCCTTPLPAAGDGNFTNAPSFTGLAIGDFRLQPNSPCINSGNNAYVTTSTDLDGHPRIVGDTVDVGAFEFQAPGSVISYAWLQQYGLATDGSVDFIDSDGDGVNNFQEFRAGTNPTNALSFLRLLAPVRAGRLVKLTWLSGFGRSYTLEYSTDLSADPPFLPLAMNVPGQAGTTSFVHSNAPIHPGVFYRVIVP